MGQSTGQCQGRKLTGMQASAIDTRLIQIAFTVTRWDGLWDHDSRTCLLRKGRPTLFCKKWTLIALSKLWPCVPDYTRSKESLHPSFLVPAILPHADQILRFAGFDFDAWIIRGPPSKILPHASGGAPLCCHPSTTHPGPGGGALSQGAERKRGSAGIHASSHPRLCRQPGTSSAGQRLLCRGDGFSVDLRCCLRVCSDQGCREPLHYTVILLVLVVVVVVVVVDVDVDVVVAQRFAERLGSAAEHMRAKALLSRSVGCNKHRQGLRRFEGGGAVPSERAVVKAVCLSLVGDSSHLEHLWAQEWVQGWEGWKELEEDGSDDMAIELAHRFLRIAGMNIPRKRKSNRERIKDLEMQKGLRFQVASAHGVNNCLIDALLLGLVAKGLAPQGMTLAKRAEVCAACRAALHEQHGVPFGVYLDGHRDSPRILQFFMGELWKVDAFLSAYAYTMLWIMRSWGWGLMS